MCFVWLRVVVWLAVCVVVCKVKLNFSFVAVFLLMSVSDYWTNRLAKLEHQVLPLVSFVSISDLMMLFALLSPRELNLRSFLILMFGNPIRVPNFIPSPLKMFVLRCLIVMEIPVM